MRYYARYSVSVAPATHARVIWKTLNKRSFAVMTIYPQPGDLTGASWQLVEDAARLIVHDLQAQERTASYEYWAANRQKDENGWPAMTDQDPRKLTNRKPPPPSSTHWRNW